MSDRAFRATCRLQVNRDFPLRDVHGVVDYLDRLGVSHVYLSPVLQARPGSMHGYDVADPSTLNPEIGTDQEWRALIDELHRRNMGVLLDIVPNHMGVGSANPFWEDVLANGQTAHYAHWFDIDWEPPQRALRGRLLVPVLGDELPTVVEREEIRLQWADDRIRLTYFDHSFPIDPATAPRILQYAAAGLPPDSDGTRALRTAVASFERIPIRTALSPERQVQRYRFAEDGWTALAGAREDHPELRQALDRALSEYPRAPEGHQRMLSFLDAQAYRLAFWRRAASEINYRRFFEINELAALRMEDPVVFGERHRLLFQWIEEGLIDGLRIDHIDGLLDPLGYLRRLRAAVEERLPAGFGGTFLIVVEKILSLGERLREEWPVEGTTGYEFLNDLEATLIDPDGAAAIEHGYRRIVRIRSASADFHEVAHRGKLHVLRSALRADVARLAALLAPIARRQPSTAALRRTQLFEGIVQMIAALPVYRTYLTNEQERIDEEDRRWMIAALDEARRRAVVPDALLELIAGAFLNLGQPESEEERAERLRFVLRFQQTSSPATAKGVEDTAIYRYLPLASLNEVGGEPSRSLRDAVGVLHEANAERQRRWPRNLLAVSTHDTKRSADVRARIDVLSEIPERWLRDVMLWRRHARVFRTRLRQRLAPDAATEYLLFQNLVGIWPALDGGRFPSDERLAEIRDRIGEYVLKASREAKAQTSWTDPDEEWERALARYIERLFDGGARSPVLRGVAALAKEIARPGLWNALSRHLLQLTAPGVPDLYQGDDLWNFSLVDPDNRRAVDWTIRNDLLERLGWILSLDPSAERERELVRQPENGAIKLHLTRLVLALRQRHPGLFWRAGYAPLAVAGAAARHIVAFARAEDGAALIVLVPRLVRSLTGGGAPPLGTEVWRDTTVRLPDRLPGTLRSLCGAAGSVSTASGARTLQVGDILDSFPVALLLADES